MTRRFDPDGYDEDGFDAQWRRRPGYEDRHRAQTEAWRAGGPYHNTVDNECCPDFSCCHPKLLAAPEVREAFCTAAPQDRAKFLTTFLGALIEAQADPSSVYLAGTHQDDN